MAAKAGAGTAGSNAKRPRPLGNRARGLVEDAMMHVTAAHKRMATIDRQAERVDELGQMADTAIKQGNVPLALQLVLDMRSASANVRRHEQDAGQMLAAAQVALGRCVRGEWE